jgi:polysaccharide biosynthesis protein PslG
MTRVQKLFAKTVYVSFCMTSLVCCTKTLSLEEKAVHPGTAALTVAATYNSNPFFADPNNVAAGACVQLAYQNLTAANFTLAKNGNFKMIRTDFFWEDVEKTTKGVYDWSFYDNVKTLFVNSGLRPFFTINKNNTLYTSDWSNQVVGTANVTAIANFAKAAAVRYNSLQPVWEIFNEPNISAINWISTKTKLQQAIDYTNMVKSISVAMRAAVPNVTIIAPGLGYDPVNDGLDLQYLEYCLQNGLLNYVDGISVHPYSTVAPEIVSLDYYTQAQNLISQYGAGRTVPVIEGETGYTFVPSWIYVTNLTVHADFIERQFLLNFSRSLPLSNYFNLFDYSDTGAYSAIDEEWNFGLCNRFKAAKPAYNRVKAMLAALSGLKFIRSYATVAGDYKLEFSNGTKYVTAAWTVNSAHSNVIYGTSVTLNGTPKYITKP